MRRHRGRESGYTAEENARLAELWDLGLSASEIAKRLGVTNNAVIGRAHRLKLHARPSPIKSARPRPPKPAVTPQVSSKPVPVSHAQARVRREIAQAEQRKGNWLNEGIRAGFNSSPAPAWLKTCQWIEAEPTARDDCKCGKPTAPGWPYCAEHWSKSWSRVNGGKPAEKAA